ncbi:MAG: hypothetical protein R2852_07335 [Bacteroidia bacterium]
MDISIGTGYLPSPHVYQMEVLENLLIDKSGLSEVYKGFKSSYYDNTYTRLGLGLVFYNKPIQLFKTEFKTEFRLGASFSFSSSRFLNGMYLTYDSTDQNGLSLIKSVNFKYRQVHEQIQLEYLICSKRFARNFKFYTGIGAAFGISHWGVGNSNHNILYANDFHYRDSMNSKVNTRSFELEQFTAPHLSFWIPFGLKYNLSCDLNLFSEFKLGQVYTPKIKETPLLTNYYINIGMRYKFKQTDIYKDKTSVFW